MASLAECRNQIIVSLDATTTTATPIAMSRLNSIFCSTELTGKSRH
jgi:hypothetical protein